MVRHGRIHISVNKKFTLFLLFICSSINFLYKPDMESPSKFLAMAKTCVMSFGFNLLSASLLNDSKEFLNFSMMLISLAISVITASSSLFSSMMGC